MTDKTRHDRRNVYPYAAVVLVISFTWKIYTSRNSQQYKTYNLPHVTSLLTSFTVVLHCLKMRSSSLKKTKFWSFVLTCWWSAKSLLCLRFWNFLDMVIFENSFTSKYSIHIVVQMDSFFLSNLTYRAGLAQLYLFNTNYKQLLDEVFVISRVIEVEVGVNPYRNLDYSGNHNNRI